jgi:hypothetical protein
VVLAIAASAIVVIGVAAFYATRGRSEPPAPAAAPVSASNTAVDARLKLAQASLQNRDYRAALTYAGEVLTLEPNHAEAARIRDEARAALTPPVPETKVSEPPPSPPVRTRRGSETTAPERRAAAPVEAPPPLKKSSPTQTSPTQTTPQPSPAPAPAAPAAEPAATTAVPVTIPPPAPVVPPPVVTPERTAPKPVPAPEPAAPVDKPPAAAAPPPAPDHDALIRSVVATYARAIETKDLALFRSIKPNLSGEEERRLVEGFRAVTSQRVTLTVLSLNRRDDEAVVVVRRRDVIEAAGRQQTAESQQTLTLTRAGTGWVISTIR